MMMMQPSLTTMKTITACKQALHLRDIERSKEWKETRKQGVRKENESLLSLKIETLLPVHNISW